MAENKPEMTKNIRKELNELTESISNMMEAFKQIRKPIQESSDKLPGTTYQLGKVTEQTEKATHRVLDMVEAIGNRETEIARDINHIRQLMADSALTSNNEISSLLNRITANANSNLNDSYNIMNALQFQDITTQQIDYAISLLDDVEDKLRTMLKAVGIKNSRRRAAQRKRERAFDPDADFSGDNPDRQKDIDTIISSLE